MPCATSLNASALYRKSTFRNAHKTALVFYTAPFCLCLFATFRLCQFFTARKLLPPANFASQTSPKNFYRSKTLPRLVRPCPFYFFTFCLSLLSRPATLPTLTIKHWCKEKDPLTRAVQTHFAQPLTLAVTTQPAMVGLFRFVQRWLVVQKT